MASPRKIARISPSTSPMDASYSTPADVSKETNWLAADRPEIIYWLFNYEPKWEAVSKEVKLLSESLRKRFATRIISLDQRGEKISLRGRDKHLPLPLGLIGLPLMMRAARAADINHVFASASAPMLTKLLASRGKTVLTIAKGTPVLESVEKNAAILKELNGIVVESERDKDLMLQLGVSPDRVQLIYPGIAPQSTRIPSGPFTIMFASSPFQKHGLLSRGINLMIEVARLLPDVRFRFVWRTGPQRVKELVRDAGTRNVEIIEGFVSDMNALYDSSHAAILPALAYNSLKPCPHSGLDSLAHGKPLLVSSATSFAHLVEERQCGVVFEPTIPSLCDAIRELKSRYSHYQANALPTSQACFSRAEFVSRYAALYSSLLRDAA
jgi:glycosyltransferase involved in cell wall biosynthesis